VTWRQTLADQRTHVGIDHPDTLFTGSNLAYALWDNGGRAAALELAEETVERMRRVLGDDHDRTRGLTSTVAEWTEEVSPAR
jgi:tetratricopeptide repeat protein